MWKAARRGAGAAAGLLIFVPELPAEDVQGRLHETARQSAPLFTVYLENDVFSGQDRHYTNGVKFSWTSADQSTWPGDSWRHRLARALPLINRRDGRKSYGFAFGQNIYTPQDIARETPDPDDRPYAGWTYLEFTASNKTRAFRDTLSLQIGIVGPHSYAEDMQRWFHDWLNDQRPAGWHHQLKDEPGINLVFERKTRVFAHTRRNFVGADLVPHLGVSVGNVQTYVNAGAIARVGFNLPNDFGIDLIRPSGGTGPVDGDDLNWRRRGGASFFVFVGADGRAVARDVFLDGNTFRDDGPSVDKESLVGDAYYGLGIVWRAWQVTYTHVARSPEFKNQIGRTSFGSVTISHAW